MPINANEIGIPNQNTYRKLSIPPLFGRPKLRQVGLPQYMPSRMWLVKLDRAAKAALTDTSSPLLATQLIGLEALQIQTVPLEMNVQPQSQWVTIPSIGRNNPFYHYTGGEDTLSFTLDWYSTKPNNSDVIEKCRQIESWSKADSYKAEPPKILLIFGQLFKEDNWIVESAEYRLSLFSRQNGMLPIQAYQELVLKKVTDKNTTQREIKWQR